MKKIGITCRMIPDTIPNNGIGKTYIEAVRSAGAIPVLIPFGASQDELQMYAELLDGLIFTGGVDLHPNLYEQQQKIGLEDIDVARDENDLRLMEWAFEQKIPIFAICRGHQLLNVFKGGTMIQDIPRYYQTDYAHRQSSPYGTVAHVVEVEEGSRLHQLFGQLIFEVNSHHHQAIEKVGDGLKATIFSPDGIIEGVELESDDHFVVGLQFHPEMLADNEDYSYMLDAFKGFIQQV